MKLWNAGNFKWLVFGLIFCLSGRIQAQYWSDSLSMNIRTSSSNPSATTATKFRLWIPAGGGDVKALILMSARGVGFNNGADGSGIYGRSNDFKFALNPILRKFAQEKGLAVLCFQGAADAGLVTDFDPTLGHADSLFKMIGHLAQRTSHPEINFVPFFAFGHSLGSVFSQNIALWNPQRVAATVMYQTGGFVQQPGWTSPFNPLLNLKDVPTLFTSGECEGPDINNNAAGFYAEATFNRTKSERTNLHPIHQVVRRNGSHSILLPLEAEMIVSFLRKAFEYRIPPSQSAATSPVQLNVINQTSGWLGNLSAFNGFNPTISAWNAVDAPNRFWLFDESYANEWKKYHSAPISFTLSRVGPFCAKDTFTVYYSCNEPINFGPSNVFRLEMSSIRGDFDSYSFPIRILGSKATAQNSGSFKVEIPDNLQRIQTIGANTPNRYRFRLVSTQPVLESNNSGEQNIGLCNTPASDLFVYPQNGGVPLQFCSGTTDSVSLTIARLPTFSLNADNQLRVQLSDANGDFGSPLLLRTLTSQVTSGGASPNITVKVGFPASLPNGLHYRMRVVSTSPASISTTSGSDISLVQNQNELLSQQGSILAPYGSRYQWLKDGQPIAGAIFQGFVPEEEGSYQCQVFNGSCMTVSNAFIQTSVSDHGSKANGLFLYPNPAKSNFAVQIPVDEPILSIQAIDVAGRIHTLSSPNGSIWFQTGNLPKGLYTIRLQTRSNAWFGRLVKE